MGLKQIECSLKDRMLEANSDDGNGASDSDRRMN